MFIEGEGQAAGIEGRRGGKEATAAAGRGKLCKNSGGLTYVLVVDVLQEGKGLIKVNGVPLSLYGSPILRPKLYGECSATTQIVQEIAVM